MPHKDQVNQANQANQANQLKDFHSSQTETQANLKRNQVLTGKRFFPIQSSGR